MPQYSLGSSASSCLIFFFFLFHYAWQDRNDDGTLVKKYVELKTFHSKAYDQSSFASSRLLKYWAQSFMAGVDRVICGVRDSRTNHLVAVDRYSTKEIYRHAANMGARWDANRCIAFLAKVLEKIQQAAQHDGQYIVSYSSHSREITVEHVVGSGRRVCTAFPSEYLKWLSENDLQAK